MVLRYFLHPDAWDEGGLLLSGSGDFAVLLIMLPHTKSECRGDNREYGEREETPSAAARPGGTGWRFRNVGVRRRRRWPPRACLRLRHQIELVHSGTSAKTPWASLPSLRLRNR